jgi:ankyrin repeat protein
VVVDQKTSDDYTPLMYAAINGNLEVVRVLLECGASLEKKRTGCTPLMFAVHHGHTA